VQVKVASLDGSCGADLDQSAGSAGIVTDPAVAQARLVEMQDCDRQW
jgi:hypothetical protein